MKSVLFLKFQINAIFFCEVKLSLQILLYVWDIKYFCIKDNTMKSKL
jgi:hypothetical protein